MYVIDGVEGYSPSSFLSAVKNAVVRFFDEHKQIKVGPGGRGGLQPPQILGNSDFLGSKRKFGQSQLLKTFSCFFINILKR